jgi:hypothetical protein
LDSPCQIAERTNVALPVGQIDMAGRAGGYAAKIIDRHFGHGSAFPAAHVDGLQFREKELE